MMRDIIKENKKKKTNKKTENIDNITLMKP